MADTNKIPAAIEAILFASGEPVDFQKLTDALGINEDELQTAADALEKRLKETESGLRLLRLDESYQLCTRAEYADYIRKVLDLRKRTPLSQAAMEVLAVIAYNQPVTRAYVEQVRGVDCSGVISSLTEKGLLEERGRLELPGRPLLYGTTQNFLRCFTLRSLDDLPRIETPENEADNTKESDGGSVSKQSSES